MRFHFFVPVFITVLFLHSPGVSFSQPCQCLQFDTLKNTYESGGAPLNRYTDKLVANANSICRAKAYEWMADDFIGKSNFDSAEIVLQKAERIYNGTSCGDSIFLTLYKEWALLYYTKADFGKAQEYTFKLLKAAEAGGNPYEIGGTYTMISQLFNQTGQAEKGIVYTRLAIPFIAKIDNPQKKADLLFKISKRYLWHFQDTETSSSLDSSELFSYLQLAIAKQNNLASSMAAVYNNLEGIAWERKDYKKVMAFLDSSLLYTAKDNYPTLAVNYFDKADLYIELKNYPAAKQMADSALYFHQKEGNIAYIADVYDLQSRIAEGSGDYKTAYVKKEAFRAITDSIRNIEKSKQVTELERKYAQAKNEKTIKELAQQKRIYFLLAIAGLLGLAALAFFLRQQSLKSKHTILETEQRLNRARMNPHFFFNALASLQSFALQGNDGKSIAGNLSKFSHIMRETLESTYKEYVTIEQETDFLSEYLELQKVRFPYKFTYAITQSPVIEPDDTLIPAMILQPFVENSIEHGFTGIDYAGHISLHFDIKDKNLQITIADNGKGMASGIKEDDGHISRASQIIKDRIYLLNIKLKTNASFSINSNKNEKGVTVLINLPLLYKQLVKAR